MDHEYQRNGVSNLFMDQRTGAPGPTGLRWCGRRLEYAAPLRYTAFEPAEAIAERLEIHYTPKHGS